VLNAECDSNIVLFFVLLKHGNHNLVDS
jgi:hypothetical protein